MPSEIIKNEAIRPVALSELGAVGIEGSMQNAEPAQNNGSNAEPAQQKSMIEKIERVHRQDRATRLGDPGTRSRDTLGLVVLELSRAAR